MAAKIRSGPTQPQPPSRIAGLKSKARSALLRVLKPYSVHEQWVDNELLTAIHMLDAGLQSVAAGQAQAERLLSETRAIPYMAAEAFSLGEHPVAGVVSGYEDEPGQTGATAIYQRFEDLFRGPEPFIRDRQRPYIGLIGKRGRVADLGCGRGEFLDLLRDAGIEYDGIDSDPDMVRHCHERGHERVEHGDMIAWLERQPDASLGAIFSAQVIEHLPYEPLKRLFELSARKLSPGGILIAETVNPHSVSAMKTFWVDPTHVRPIFPEVALALARFSGFGAGFVFHPNGIGNVEADRYMEGEYALVATRTSEEPRLGGRELHRGAEAVDSPA